MVIWFVARTKASKAPTMTKLIDRVEKDDDGRGFVRCRLEARDFKPRREGPRDDSFAAMPPLQAKKAQFAHVSGVRQKRREQGQDEVKLILIDVTKAHLNAKCDEKERCDLPDELKKVGKCARLRRWLHGVRKVASGWEDDNARRLVNDGL